jgi:hypothetical protein
MPWSCAIAPRIELWRRFLQQLMDALKKRLSLRTSTETASKHGSDRCKGCETVMAAYHRVMKR